MTKNTGPGNCQRLFLLFAFLIVINPSQKIFSQSYNIDFDRVGIEQGLSQSSVQAIVQDSLGFLWFATQDGLNQYDGYNFKIFKHETNDSLSISDDWISALCIDQAGNLWIGTAGGGLNKYDKNKGLFRQYRHRAKPH